MHKLTEEELEKILSLVRERIDLIGKESYTNDKVADEYFFLGMIAIKVDAQRMLSKDQTQETFLNNFTNY